jgi:small-conductance mechanosensitive channel
MRYHPVVKRLIAPSLLFALCLLAHEMRESWSAILPFSELRIGQIQRGALTLLWLASIWLAMRVLTGVVRGRTERRTQRPAPALLLDLLAGTVWLVGLSGLAVVVFGVAPSAAFATSGMVIAVVGFAVRHMVADLFYGVTLALERPFEIGDWIQLQDEVIGRVSEMTWRAVKLVTPANIKVIVPNSTLAIEEIKNYDQPDSTFRSALQITLGYDVATDEAERLLLSAVEQVPESAALPHHPDARIVAYENHGVTWELRFWLPDFPTSARVTQLVNTALLRALYFAGISVPRRREEVFVGGLEQERAADAAVLENWIDRIALFAPIPARGSRRSVPGTCSARCRC